MADRSYLIEFKGPVLVPGGRPLELISFSPRIPIRAPGGGGGPGKFEIEAFDCMRDGHDEVSQRLYVAAHNGQVFDEVILSARDGSERGRVLIQYTLKLAMIMKYASQGDAPTRSQVVDQFSLEFQHLQGGRA